MTGYVSKFARNDWQLSAGKPDGQLLESYDCCGSQPDDQKTKMCLLRMAAFK